MTTSGTLFGRQYLVTLSADGVTGMASYGNLSTLTQQASDLRIEFDIVKNAKDSPNKGTVAITNMSPTNRQALRPGLQCILKAGYLDISEVLFKAGVFLIKSERAGPDITTTLELMDGDGAIANITFDASYTMGSAIRQVFLDMIAKLAVPTLFTPYGIQVGHIGKLPEGNWQKGFTANGPLRQTLGDLCRNFGLEWSIQDNLIQINPLDEHVGDSGQVISPATGMLGVPSFDGTVLNVKTLLNPRLQPGKLVSVQSRDINGTFKIRGGHWKGDSHGDDWTVELECIPMAATAADLAQQLGVNTKDAAKAIKAATAKPKKAGKTLTSKTLGAAG